MKILISLEYIRQVLRNVVIDTSSDTTTHHRTVELTDREGARVLII